MLAEGARTDHFDTGFDMNFDLNFYNKGKDIFNQGTPTNQWATLHQYTYGSMAEGKHKLRFISNHPFSSTFSVLAFGIYLFTLP